MDVRDFSTWAVEAKRRVFMRRSDLYTAALLPNQKEANMRAVINSVENGLYEIDHEEDIAKIEAMAQRRLKEIRAQKQKKAARRQKK